MFSTYTHPFFSRHIDREKVNVVFEIGSRDGRDAVMIRDHYQADVYAVECNPEAVRLMEESLRDEPGITLIPKGAWDHNGRLPFFPVVRTLDEGRAVPPNIGASSFYRARDDYRQTYEQCEITVEVFCLDDYCRERNIETIDLLCMDVQGAALRVLQGLRERIGQVRYIITELERVGIYHDQDLFDDVDLYLREHGFERKVEMPRDPWFSDFLYCRSAGGGAPQLSNPTAE